ncbi:hypothetical protein TRIP_C90229 [Candidatus Zixiibacteriota bacterium]|nr:hypothetical protein TRIP_C90229 [candidate division Zixibacteria bacterium]
MRGGFADAGRSAGYESDSICEQFHTIYILFGWFDFLFQVIWGSTICQGATIV